MSLICTDFLPNSTVEITKTRTHKPLPHGARSVIVDLDEGYPDDGKMTNAHRLLMHVMPSSMKQVSGTSPPHHSGTQGKRGKFAGLALSGTKQPTNLPPG